MLLNLITLLFLLRYFRCLDRHATLVAQSCSRSRLAGTYMQLVQSI